MPRESIELLNRLPQCAVDGCKGLAHAAERMTDQDLKQILAEHERFHSIQ